MDEPLDLDKIRAFVQDGKPDWDWLTYRNTILALADEVERSYEIADVAAAGLMRERQRAETAEQALWDVYGILGFDQDGDPTPAAVVDLIEVVKNAAREYRADCDASGGKE